MLYSPQTKGFYSTEVHGENTPQDAIIIDDEHYEALLEGQSNGLVIELGEDGLPTLVSPPAVPPSPADVVEERKRRLALGFDFDFGDERGIHTIGTTPGDMVGWDEVTRWAASQLALNKTGTLLIKTDTGTAEVTAAEWYEVIEAASAVHQPIWQASFALQAMDAIPDDYANDKWWP